MSIHALRMRLGEVAHVRAGFSFRGPIEEVADGPVRVVHMKAMNPLEGIKWDSVRRTVLDPRRQPDWLVPGDLILVARGQRFYAVLVDKVPDSTVCDDHLFRLRRKPDAEVLPAFLVWQINQAPFQRELHRRAEGSNQKSVRRPEIEAVPVGIPSLADQERIVNLARLASRERELQQRIALNREQLFVSIAEGLVRRPQPA